MAIGTNTSILWGDTMSKVRSSITMASDSWKDKFLRCTRPIVTRYR